MKNKLLFSIKQTSSAWLIALCTLTTIPAVADNNSSKIKVMSQNLYLGGDVSLLLSAASDPNPLAVPLAATELWQQVQATNFPERAELIADQILDHQPDVIGLQEVFTWRTQFPGDVLLGNPMPAEDIAYDFLGILLDALEARGLDYAVAAHQANLDLELPVIAGFSADGSPLFADVRLSDSTAILVNNSTGLSYSNPFGANYSANIALSLGGFPLEILRGFTLLNVNVNGSDFLVANTHLEVGGMEPFRSIQAVQMHELLQTIGVLNAPGQPVVLLGDFNSSPEDEVFISGSGIPGLDGQTLVPPYLQAASTNYSDLWLGKKKPKDGFTCCFDPLLVDPASELNQRIDHIFVNPNDRRINNLKIKRIGHTEDDFTLINGLRPSDHVGLIGRVKLHP